MRKIKITWSGRRHDILLRETDKKFQALIKGLESLKIKFIIEGKHDWGIGIPLEKSSYDLKLIVLTKKLFSKERIALFEIWLNHNQKSLNHIYYPNLTVC